VVALRATLRIFLFLVQRLKKIERYQPRFRPPSQSDLRTNFLARKSPDIGAGGGT
jgi:hypothetical protein